MFCRLFIPFMIPASNEAALYAIYTKWIRVYIQSIDSIFELFVSDVDFSFAVNFEQRKYCEKHLNKLCFWLSTVCVTYDASFSSTVLGVHSLSYKPNIKRIVFRNCS